MQKNRTGPLPCTQINSRWIENLSVKLETTDHLEENMSKLLNIDFGNDFFFLHLISKAEATKIKINN